VKEPLLTLPSSGMQRHARRPREPASRREANGGRPGVGLAKGAASAAGAGPSSQQSPRA